MSTDSSVMPDNMRAGMLPILVEKGKEKTTPFRRQFNKKPSIVLGSPCQYLY